MNGYNTFLNENKEIDIQVFVNGKFNNNLNFKYDDKFKQKKRKVSFKLKENINKDIVNIEFK